MRPFRGVEFFCERSFARNSIGVNVLSTDSSGQRCVLHTPASSIAEPGALILEAPLLSLAPEEAQNLIDELWRCGMRPTEGTGSAGSLAATERHLQDMRLLAGVIRT